jgi:hypothetical protein
MQLYATPYQLGKWKKNMNSICPLFTSKKRGFVPLYHLVKEGGWEAVLRYYQSLGEFYYQRLVEMLIFDVIILNTDRHFGNFGLLIDNDTNEIIDVAPIFDNGLSLFWDALDDDLDDTEAYVQTKSMKNAGDFMQFAQQVITKEAKAKVRKLIGFTFDRSGAYKLPSKRLEKIEASIQQRVQILLEMRLP